MVRSRRGPPDRPPRTGPRRPPGRAGPSGPGHCWSWPPRPPPRCSPGVGIAQKTGFGLVSPLPGTWPVLHLDTAITLPVGVEGLRGVRPAGLALARPGGQRPDTPAREVASDLLIRLSWPAGSRRRGSPYAAGVAQRRGHRLQRGAERPGPDDQRRAGRYPWQVKMGFRLRCRPARELTRTAPVAQRETPLRDLAGQRRYVIMRACRGGRPTRGTTRYRVRIDVPRGGGWRAWEPSGPASSGPWPPPARLCPGDGRAGGRGCRRR